MSSSANLAQVRIQIARLPIGVVAGAYNKYHPNPQAGITKADAVRWLADMVNAGSITFENIQDSAPAVMTSPSDQPV